MADPSTGSNLDAQVAISDDIAELRATTTAALVTAGIAPDDARTMVDDAANSALLNRRNPDQRAEKVRVELTTLTYLMTASVPKRTFLSDEEIFARPISLRRILHDADRLIQVRVVTLDATTLEQYTQAMMAGDVFPPIVCFWDAEAGVLHLADGFHRCHAALQCDPPRMTIEAAIYAGTRDDALEYAATCNAQHGLPLTAADKREAIKRLLKLHPQQSSREIARSVGCSHHTVEDERKAAIASGQIAQMPEKRTATRDGKPYTYTPPAQPEYATDAQIANCVETYLDNTLGRRGWSNEADATARLALLNAIATDSYRMPDRLRLPDHYHKRDLIQTINSTMETLVTAIAQFQAKRVVGTGVKGLKFYDDTRTLQAEVDLQADGTLNIGGESGGGGGAAGGDGAPVDAQYETVIAPTPHVARFPIVPQPISQAGKPVPVDYLPPARLRTLIKRYLTRRWGAGGGQGRDGLHRLTILEDMIAEDYEPPPDLGLPDNYNRHDFAAAAIHIRSKLRYDIGAIQRDAAQDTEPVEEPKTPTIHPTTGPKSALIEDALLAGRWGDLRFHLSSGERNDFVRALRSIYGGSNLRDHATAAQTLIDTIQQPCEETA